MACGSLGYLVCSLINYFYFRWKEPKKNPTTFFVMFFVGLGIFCGTFLTVELGKLIPPTYLEVKKTTLLPFGLDNTMSDDYSDVYMVIRSGMIQKGEEFGRAYLSFLEETEPEKFLIKTAFFETVETEITFLPEDWNGGAWVQFQKPKRNDFWRHFVIYPKKESYFIPPSGIRRGKIAETYKFIP